MKKAISYIRISDKDQSRWSISGQQESHSSYSDKNNISIIATFIDKGQSAKNFDRANWKELEEFVKQNHSITDFLLVYDWTRFSRNTKEALQMIELLEIRYKIRIISITQPIGLHPESPYYHHLRQTMIQNGELELRIIRDRTKFGLQQAAKQGRYTTAAPFGYTNARDASDTPVILVNISQAPVVEDIFNRFLSGQTIADIRKAMKGKCSLTGNSSYQKLLQNPVYMGYVKKSAYYDDPETLVKGIHQPIITEEIFYRAQAIFQSKKPLQRTVQNEQVPLKGVLNCFCGRAITAGNSKGRSAYYWYYKCNSHPALNLPAPRLHQQFEEILKVLSFPKFHIDYLQAKTTELIKQRIKERSTELSAKENEYKALQLKIDGLEEKYITNSIEAATYRKWKARYTADTSLLQSQITTLRQPIEKVWQDHRAGLERLADIHYLYNCCTLEGKQSFVRLVFNNQLYYQERIYRTAFLLAPFHAKAVELKEKGLLDYQQPEEKVPAFAGSAPHRNIIEPLEQLLFWAGSVKIA